MKNTQRRYFQDNILSKPFFYIDANDSVTIANTNANSKLINRSEFDIYLNDISNKNIVKQFLKKF